ncbi:hypothetical protein [Enterococcus cecorum]|nr:hypothetical protein [Enterococcus cecorum]
MRMFDFESANKWLEDNWDVIKSQQYINVIKRCLEKEKATENNQ